MTFFRIYGSLLSPKKCSIDGSLYRLFSPALYGINPILIIDCGIGYCAIYKSDHCRRIMLTPMQKENSDPLRVDELFLNGHIITPRIPAKSQFYLQIPQDIRESVFSSFYPEQVLPSFADVLFGENGFIGMTSKKYDTVCRERTSEKKNATNIRILMGIFLRDPAICPAGRNA